MELAALTIVHGARDSGKTRSVQALAARCRAAGLSVGGVLSLATLVAGSKESYRFLDLGGGVEPRPDARPGAGQERLYAVRRTGPLPAGSLAYRFLETGLEFGREAIRGAARAGVQVLFVDEIGPLEMANGGLWEAVRELPGVYHGRLVLTVRSSLAEALVRKLRAGSPGLDVAVLTPDGADRL